MTTAVTVKHANTDVCVYQADLNKDLEGDFKLVAKITEGEQTFYVHGSQDLMITENALAE